MLVSPGLSDASRSLRVVDGSSEEHRTCLEVMVNGIGREDGKVEDGWRAREERLALTRET